MVKAMQGSWVNVDCPSERYVVSGQNVTRTDALGSRNFTLHWDHDRKQLQWGTQGRLSLTWLGEGLICWEPARQHARSWRWKRVGASPTLSPAPSPWCPAAALKELAVFDVGQGRGFSRGFNGRDSERPLGYGPWRRPNGNQRLGRGGSRGDWSFSGRSQYGPYGRGPSGERLPCGLLASEVCDLLFRDITPDDYETLLRLDETVSRPTASSACVERLPMESGKDLCGEDCSVCLVPFEESDTVTTLPCRHRFHRGCVAKWLTECRNACPLCGGDLAAKSAASAFPEDTAEDLP